MKTLKFRKKTELQEVMEKIRSAIGKRVVSANLREGTLELTFEEDLTVSEKDALEKALSNLRFSGKGVEK